jgi:hypothetical protein
MKLTPSTLLTCAVLPVLPALQTYYEPLLHAVLCCCLLYDHKMYPWKRSMSVLGIIFVKEVIMFQRH